MRLFAILVLAAIVHGQANRSAYLAAYKAWREAEPSLERDAGAGAASVPERASRAGGAAEKFAHAKAEFYRAAGSEYEQHAKWLGSGERPAPVSSLDSLKTYDDFLGSEIRRLDRIIKVFAADRDPGMQRLRQALERERSALDTVKAGLADRQKSLEETRKAVEGADRVRSGLAEEVKELAAAIAQGGQAHDRESSQWRAYYQKIAEVGAAARPSGPAAETPKPRPTAGGISLTRYTGGWTFPTQNGMFHGAEPEFVDLIVREESGTMEGSLYARFKLPPGSTGDPLVRFEFRGPLGSGRTQRFNLQTNDGADGNIELIPGPAVNLLEINFTIVPRPNKISQANVVLIKK